MSITLESFAKRTEPFKERLLFPIVQPTLLLASSKRQKLIGQIRQLAIAPTELFDPLYQELINNFVKFVQVIPTNTFTRLGSLMDDGLFRATFALENLRQDQSSKEIDPLMAYVLFCAALLFDVGYVTENRVVAISNRSGEFIKLWHPHLGSMIPGDGYYKIRRGGGMPPWLSRRVSTLYARQIIPPAAFNWIAKNPFALNTWIALMHDEKVEADGLKLHLDRASSMLDAIKLKDDYAIEIDIKGEDPSETADGENFVEWLQRSLGDNSVSVNSVESYLHVVNDGFFMEIPGVLKDFCKQASNNPSWSIVLEQFVKLGFVVQKDATLEFEKYYYLNRDTPTAANESYPSFLGQLVNTYGIREGLTIKMPFYLVLFCIRYYPHLNKYFHLAGDHRNRMHPTFKEFFNNLTSPVLTDTRRT